MRRAASLASLALAVALALTGCTSANDALAQDYQQGGEKGYISGDGSVQLIAADDREPAVAFTGTAIDGSMISSTDYAGSVLVVNFWYAGCGPCRAEASVLESTYQAVQDEGAAFLGINVYDGAETAAAFEETYGLTYPSLLAHEDVDLKLTFAEWTSLSSTPTTLVLDAQGRVAARVLGQVTSESILKSIVTDLVAES
ncbi:MAG: TlpA disulfide reductase family protein [Microbacterium sp.]